MCPIAVVEQIVSFRSTDRVRSHAAGVSENTSPHEIRGLGGSHELFLGVQQKAKVRHTRAGFQHSGKDPSSGKGLHQQLCTEIFTKARRYGYFVARMQVRKELIRHGVRGEFFVTQAFGAFRHFANKIAKMLHKDTKGWMRDRT
jgi:hypothetical protein